ncbi:DUF6320 domain-containing protein [Gulosibacter molinativorax]|uniref:Zinc ribbon domain-containing protein n=1 Tax=Gulosibacter molinativorax TaxID=256821 RepID=A0ABT7C6Q9_9MICO|nr:DUF6320 domain-containing protein [Gulosibacter molinativorax]MDJ1370869.1 hypothetical protein [Gulosibacter molinativorax]QUY62206.1 Hypothetical protein GMOLON4_1503 [Gulosibacter molinativorax]
MARCEACNVEIEGSWAHCPLCGNVVTGSPAPSPLPAIPLSFSRRRILRALFLISLAIILASFAAQLFFSHEFANIGVARSIWLGLTALWLVVLTAARKRRNLAKSTVYLVILVSLICVYWDFLTGWHGWALTYTVPILCASAIVALLVTVRLMRIESGEHIVYSGLTVLLGLLPIGFVAFGWVTTPWPSIICGALSLVALVIIQVFGGRAVRRELGKRLHL